MSKNTQVIENLLRETVNVLKEGGGESEEIAQIAQAAEAYNTGKVELAQNITAKGVQASATETLPELAQKVSAITQDTIVIDGGEMYAKQLFGSLETPNYWNLYEVLASLLNDGRLVNYGGILLAEYYKGYDSLALAGAGAGGAYVVSDMENGVFKMYTEDVTHIWNDANNGKGNRWVAYCFADEYHDFQITNTNTSPRSIFIGRKVGTITNLVNGCVSQIVVPDGNVLKHFACGNFTNQWDKKVVLRNLENIPSTPLYRQTSIETVYIKSTRISAFPLISNGGDSTAWQLKTLLIECDYASSFAILGLGSNTSAFNNLSDIFIKVNNSGVVYMSSSYNQITQLNGLKNFIVTAESVTIWSQTPYKLQSFTKIWLNYISNDKSKTVDFNTKFPAENTFNTWLNITDVELQNNWCKPLNLRDYFRALTEANIYAHILQRLKQDEPDCGDGVTITLGSGNLAKLTSAESQALLAELRGTYGYTFA